MHISLLCPIMLRLSFTCNYKQIHCAMCNLVVCDKYNTAFTKAPYCKVLLIVKGCQLCCNVLRNLTTGKITPLPLIQIDLTFMN